MLRTLGRRYFPTILIVALAVFNDGAMIALSKDRVISSPVPNHWNLRNIFISGARPHPACAWLEVLIVACLTSLGARWLICTPALCAASRVRRGGVQGLTPQGVIMCFK